VFVVNHHCVFINKKELIYTNSSALQTREKERKGKIREERKEGGYFDEKQPNNLNISIKIPKKCWNC
jgi:hypothetical protein